MKDTRDKLVVIFLFALFTNLFLFQRVGTWGAGIFLSGICGLGIGLFGSYKKILLPSPERSALLLTCFAVGMLTIVDSPLRILLIILGTLAGYVSTTYVLLRGYTPQGIWESISALFQVPGEYARSFIVTLAGGAKGETPTVRSKTPRTSSPVRSVLVGVAVGLPLVIWMTALLSNADPVFGHYVQTLFSKEFLQRIPVRLFVTGFTFAALLPTLGMRLARPFRSPAQWLTRSSWHKEISVILAMVAGVMGLFLIVQWPYVFARVADETRLSLYGVATYSEYVQKGFGELVKVAVIVFGISWASYLVSRSSSRSQWQLGLQSLLGIEFIIFVLSLIRRVYLYTQYHGLSLARLYGLAFLIWLIGMSILLAYRFVVRRSLARIEVGWTVVAWALTIVLNMQSLILRNPPTVNNRVDYVYLARLSADGHKGWEQSYTWAVDIVDKESQNTGIITQENRRDIYYAQLILDSVYYHYVELVQLYGSPTERLEYARDAGTEAIDSLDRFLSWNRERATSYRQLMQFTTYQDLVTYRRMVHDLFVRIDHQPAGEREYDVDISFDTPFL